MIVGRWKVEYNIQMKKIYIIIFVSTILVWGFYCIRFGIGMFHDSWQYSGWADVLISKNFNINMYLKTIEFTVPPYLYLGFVSLVAFSKIVFGAFWQTAIVIINILLGALLAVVLADLVYSFTKNKISACFIPCLYILNPEIMFWSRFVLSDISYMFINFCLFYLTAKLFLADNKRIIGYSLVIILILFLNCIYRPVGLVMIPVIIFAFYLKMPKRKMRWGIFFFSLTVFALVLISFHSAVIKNTVLWPFEFGKNYLSNSVVGTYREGMVIRGRPHTYHLAPVTIGDYISITLDKFVHYFYFSDKMFKFFHKIINYLIFLPLYSLFILGIIGTFKKASLPNVKSLIALSLIIIIGFSLFHASTGLDYHWRFRLPIFPYLLFVAGIGLDFLLRSFSRRRHFL